MTTRHCRIFKQPGMMWIFSIYGALSKNCQLYLSQAGLYHWVQMKIYRCLMFLQEYARFRTQPWKYFFLLEYSYHRNQLLSVRFRTLHCHISRINFHRNISVNLFFILSKLKWRKYALVHMISGLFSISLNLMLLLFMGFL